MNHINMQTRLVSSMERVFPIETLDAKKWESGSAFLGERLNFQLAYLWQDYPAWAEAEAESSLANVSIRRVDLEPASYVCPPNGDSNYLRRSAGLFPDILMPLEGRFKLVPGQWRSLWISIDTRDEAPGEYPVTVRIRTENEIVCEETFTFTLLPARLPEQTLKFTQWMHTDCIYQQYDAPVFSERWWELLERYVAFAAEHGMNMLLTPLFTPPLDTLPGTERPTVQLVDVEKKEDGWAFGFSRLERWLSMCERCGIKYLEGSHLFTQWGAAHAPKIMAKADGTLKRVFGWETEAAGQEYTAFLEAFLPELTAFLRQRGLQERFYFHISDEPSKEQLEQYEKLSKLVHRLTPGFQVMDALSDYDFYENGLMEVPVCAIDHIEPFLAHGTPHLWAYYCVGQAVDVSNRFLALPGARNRCIGLQLYDAGIEGFLHWGHNFWMTQFATQVIDPYKVSDAGGAFLAGDSFSVYPGKDGPVAAVSLELFLEALQDMRALQLLESLGGRQEAQESYAEWPYKDFAHCPSQADEVLALRRRINDRIMELYRG